MNVSQSLLAAKSFQSLPRSSVLGIMRTLQVDERVRLKE
jgi:hypothetical protein